MYDPPGEPRFHVGEVVIWFRAPDGEPELVEIEEVRVSDRGPPRYTYRAGWTRRTDPPRAGRVVLPEHALEPRSAVDQLADLA